MFCVGRTNFVNFKLLYSSEKWISWQVPHKNILPIYKQKFYLWSLKRFNYNSSVNIFFLWEIFKMMFCQNVFKALWMELPCKSNFKLPQNFVASLPPIYWLDANIVKFSYQNLGVTRFLMYILVPLSTYLAHNSASNQ